MFKKSFQTPPPIFFVVCSEDSSRIGPLGLLSRVHVFNAFFVVVGSKSDQDFPSKPHPPAFLFFHMGKHACKIYRYFMKISSFENVFFCVISGRSCDLMRFSAFKNDDFESMLIILVIFKV